MTGRQIERIRRWCQVAVTLGCLTPVFVTASDVTGLTTFVPGTPALADEVNENFDVIRSAVNDNDSRLEALEASPAPTSSAASYSAFAFSNWQAADTNSCLFRRLVNYGYFEFPQALGSGCAVTVGVNLPHGATVTGVSCLVDDEVTGTVEDTRFFPVTLRRMSLATGNADVLFSTSTVSSDVGLQTLVANLAVSEADAVVDNEGFAYTLRVAFNFADDVATGVTLRLYGCKVTYTTPS